jgi:hypothetical protein
MTSTMRLVWDMPSNMAWMIEAFFSISARFSAESADVTLTGFSGSSKSTPKSSFSK